MFELDELRPDKDPLGKKEISAARECRDHGLLVPLVRKEKKWCPAIMVADKPEQLNSCAIRHMVIGYDGVIRVVAKHGSGGFTRGRSIDDQVTGMFQKMFPQIKDGRIVIHMQ
jgi:hypothetical protein